MDVRLWGGPLDGQSQTIKDGRASVTFLIGMREVANYHHDTGLSTQHRTATYRYIQR